MKSLKLLVAATAGAAVLGLSAAPALADVVGGTLYGTQTTAISAVNTLLAPTGISVQSTWINVTLGSTTIPIDPPFFMF